MIFTPKGFLIVGGIVLVIVGVLGMVGVIGPTADQSIFHSTWWFDGGENWAHLILGIVGLIAAFVLPAGAQRGLVVLLGLVGLFFFVYNLFNEDFYGAHLEKYADAILHLVVGLWALIASRKSSMPMNTTQQPGM